MPPLHGKDIVAVVMVLAMVALKYQGYDGGLDSMLTLIVGYYFGHRVSGIDSGAPISGATVG